MKTGIKTRLLEGKDIAEEILGELKRKRINKKINLKLSIILIGHDAASELYVRKKCERCKKIGIGFELIRFEEEISEDAVKDKIKELNHDKKVTGILVQLPLPKNLNTERVVNTILPEKDVDGLTLINREKLAKGDETLACCTAKGIIILLEKNNIKLKGKKIILVGYGYLVGQPLSLMLKNRGLEFTVYDINTKNLREKTQKADVLISATGVPHLIKTDYIKKGVVIVDVGVSKINGEIVGDVDFEGLKEKASWITPSKKGVGPMTIAVLLENLFKAYELQNSKGI